MVVPLPDDPVTGAGLASGVKAAVDVGAPAVFGKLPAHGDFVARGFDVRTRDAIDRWLSDAMTRARATHGDAFDDLYERAAPWQFAFPRGDTWAAGALTLSADAAGRRFPLYAERLVERECAGAAANTVEAAIYRAIVEGLAADAAVAAVAQENVCADEIPAQAGWRNALGAIASDDPQPVDIVSRMLEGASGWE